MHPAAPAGVEQLAEAVRAPGLVVDVADERVLDAHAPSGRLEVAAGRVQGLCDVPALVDRDEVVAQLVVGGVQAQRQRRRDALGRELVDGRHEPDGRHRDAARGDAEAVGGGLGEPADGGDGGLVVRQRLPHAHEDDVADAALPAGDLAAGQGARGGRDLLDDLGGRQVARQPGLPGGAERAVHAAAGLAGDAQGVAVLVAHEDRLDERAVVHAVQRLDRGALVGREGADRRQERRQQRVSDPGPAGRRQVRHPLRVVLEPLEPVRGELLAAERLLPQLDHRGPALGGFEVDEVARGLAAAGADMTSWPGPAGASGSGSRGGRPGPAVAGSGETGVGVDIASHGTAPRSGVRARGTTGGAGARRGPRAAASRAGP